MNNIYLTAIFEHQRRDFFCLRKKNIWSPEFKYDIDFSLSCKVSERQAFITSNTSIIFAFFAIQYWSILTCLKSKKMIFCYIFSVEYFYRGVWWVFFFTRLLFLIYYSVFIFFLLLFFFFIWNYHIVSGFLPQNYTFINSHMRFRTPS